MFRERIRGTDCLVTYQKSQYSGMILVTRRAIALLEGYHAFHRCYGCCFPCDFGNHRSHDFPGNQENASTSTILTDSMAHFNQDDMGMRFVVAPEDETGRLVASFNKMMDIINQLIESEYEGKVRLKGGGIEAAEDVPALSEKPDQPSFPL